MTDQSKDMEDLVKKHSAKSKAAQGQREIRFPERMTARDVMFIAVSVNENMDLMQFLDILRDSDANHFIVTSDEGKVVGLVTETDLLKLVAKPRLATGIGALGYKEALYRSSGTVGGIMQTHPLFVYDTQPLSEVASIMRKYNAHHVIVLKADKTPVGMIGTEAVVRVLHILLR
jgi:CBS domain-containing protein